MTSSRRRRDEGSMPMATKLVVAPEHRLVWSVEKQVTGERGAYRDLGGVLARIYSPTMIT